MKWLPNSFTSFVLSGGQTSKQCVGSPQYFFTETNKGKTTKLNFSKTECDKDSDVPSKQWPCRFYKEAEAHFDALNVDPKANAPAHLQNITPTTIRPPR